MILPFTKMHGNGNDFIVVNNLSGLYPASAALCRQLAHRHFGIGADQLLWIEPSTNAAADFNYRIYNADGGEVEMCGNGARAFFQYLLMHGLSTKPEITVWTKAGLIRLRASQVQQSLLHQFKSQWQTFYHASGVPLPLMHDWVEVDMGAPIFDAANIPFNPVHCHAITPAANKVQTDQTQTTWQLLPAAGEQCEAHFFVVSMGNPHAVTTVSIMNGAELARIGTWMQTHPAFPARVNVGMMRVHTPQLIELRVFERGVGETLSCGTGACAAVVSGICQGVLAHDVLVMTRGGLLHISWLGLNQSVLMRGSAHTTFEGQWQLADTSELI